MPYLSGYEAPPPFLGSPLPPTPKPSPPPFLGSPPPKTPPSWQPPRPSPPPLSWQPPFPPPNPAPPPPALKVVRDWEGVGVWPVATAPPCCGC